ncbi:MAG TPA: UDP-N-acetylmuramoyl-tripeptide--D-alanyl-D-alanine ligase [Burkholderiaceae bacterium]|nr:UDP-N-acetylmuramoyl-tripeptide--D-alanyl-D-alanine ligase [Burkholderiaceae bacterium]
MMTLAQAHALLPASTLVGDGATEVLRVHSDTRSLQPCDLFVALRGERFDAHAYLAQARASGAAAAIAERGLLEAGLAGLQVADTQVALAELARAWRHRFALPLVAVTGSNGKTTVTQMIASILRAWLAEAAFATAGNFNNHIGLPLTLLRLRQDDTTWHRAGVVELGMNHPGEIARLAALAAPTVALVNNAQREHQEFMASVEAVALENGAVIQALGPSGVAVFPADDAHTALWHALAANRPTLSFALQGHADVTCVAEWDTDHWALVLETPAGATTLQLRAAGMHNVKNALAASACALAVGCPLEAIARGLEAFEPVKGRSQSRTITHRGRTATLIDDSYNANPDSVRAAIEVLAALPGPRFLVLGDMGEVGDQGPAFHAEVASYAKARGIDALWVAGAMSVHAARAFAGARHFDAVASLIAALSQAPDFNTVLVKGSRFMRMEQVVSALTNPEGTHAA